MITVKVYFKKGKDRDTIKTGINANLETAKKYYLNKWFNIGRGEYDYMMYCYKVELI